jgi:TPR repeat protein
MWQPLSWLDERLRPAARLRRALAQAEAGQGARAFPVLARAASKGNAVAQFRLGRGYLEGLGVPRSRAEASRWLLLAAKGGHTEAQFLLATLFAYGSTSSEAALLGGDGCADAPDHGSATHWAQQAMAGGSTEAVALLAYLLSSGPDGTRNRVEADRLYAQAARAGSAQGALGHGLALLRRTESRWAARAAASYLGRAAKAGLPMGIFLSGVVHEQGIGLAADKAAAAELFRQAAERGLPK